MKITTLGEFRKITKQLDDSFKIDLRIRTRLWPDELVKLSYPYPYKTEYTYLEFDDIGWSDKELCLGVEIKGQ